MIRDGIRFSTLFSRARRSNHSLGLQDTVCVRHQAFPFQRPPAHKRANGFDDCRVGASLGWIEKDVADRSLAERSIVGRCSSGAKVKKRIVVVVALAVLVALALTECMSLTAGAHDPAFFDIVQTGTPQDVQAAINKGADVNDHSNSGWTPLMAAAMMNPHPEMLTYS